ncbi:DUF551 domain-containing protein [Citrobacter portucalensis]|uniref:DUF551 domain-containing protein n=1 Tax=Citrobacter portucalensis TaxID=1639133 RepID=A0ABZ0H7J3_9ENTR|nr:DUF551 domain-containing protein [Citrobacter portucalensis]MEB2741405.1 DUF551 domain-containing protein [Citrobacter portucalensis]WOH45301.1 DUF551 domain-containing protein [Citrobacter portucalensis]
MSTITRELAKLFRKITNSEIDAEGNAHVVLSPADSLLINNARIALASLEAEASGRNPVLAYADSYRDMANQGVESIPVWSVITDLERNIAPLFTAPPAPVSVPAAMEMDDDFDSAFEHGKAVGWNACRAAMLQGVDRPQNEPQNIPENIPFDQWLSQQTGTIDVECGCVMTEVFFHWLRVAYEAGKSPVIPDGWKLVPIDPTKDMLRAGQSVVGFWLNTVHCYSKMLAAAPAAPQQEVNNG